MPAFKDLSGHKFNRLTVIKRSGKDKQGNALWECLCDCGNTSVVRTFLLKNGQTRSCGCIVKEMRTTHGMRFNKIYKTWAGMKQRCHNSSDAAYRNYGGRGITVCDRWRNSFQSFFDDMGEKPDNMTIDRIDNNKGYYPDNCRWATVVQQANNVRTNKIITFHGISRTYAEWGRIIGGCDGIVSSRISRGWSEERAITTLARGRHD